MNYVGFMGSILYDCMLSMYFVMVVVYSTREDFIQKRIEPFFHTLSIIVPVGVGIFLMATGYFNDTGNLCFIAPFPADYNGADAKDECARGKNAKQYRLYFQGFPFIVIVLIVIACMLHLSCSVRKQSKKMMKYGANEFTANVKRKRKQSTVLTQSTLQYKKKKIMNTSRESKAETKQLVTQASLYVLALCIAILFAFTFQIVGKYFWLYLLQMTFTPLLGFFNFIIFIRPRVVMIRQSKPDLSFFQVFITAITANEVTSRFGRKASTLAITRRGSQTCKPRNSLLMSDTVLIASRIVQAEESKEEEDEHGLEYGALGMESDPLPNDKIGEMCNDPLPGSPVDQEIKYPLDTIEGAEAEVFVNEDECHNLISIL